jgi:hypothetical protein
MGRRAACVYTWIVVTTATRRLNGCSQNVPTFPSRLSIKTITNAGLHSAQHRIVKMSRSLIETIPLPNFPRGTLFFRSQVRKHLELNQRLVSGVVVKVISPGGQINTPHCATDTGGR